MSVRGAKKPLVLAVPSKGRLQENAPAFFARAGLDIAQSGGARDYRGNLAGMENVEIAFLSAADIVAQLAAGHVHLGVTGEDLVRETIADVEAKVELLAPLGFGHAHVVVGVPRAWIDVKTMADLEDVAAGFRARRGERVRVATKYVHLTRRFFAERHVADYRIVESLGATEGAPAAGKAELIVDITTTGAKLLANALMAPSLVHRHAILFVDHINLDKVAKWATKSKKKAVQATKPIMRIVTNTPNQNAPIGPNASISTSVMLSTKRINDMTTARAAPIRSPTVFPIPASERLLPDVFI